MITVEDKISTFSKYVYDKELELSNQKLEEVEKKNKEVIQSKQKEIEKKCMDLNRKMHKKIELESQKIISNAKLEARNKTLTIKKELLEQFMQEILDSLKNFTETEDYKIYLKKTLENVKDFLRDNTVKIYLTKKDVEKFASEIKSKYPQIEIAEMEEENIGGMILESTINSERIDATLRTKVRDWKSEIGLRLYEALEK
ncbi:V-type ATP synthase subunit E [Garciella nitratireducens]|uniref:H+-ATPase subunit E/Vma4 n=1 Tax=Garciella nitratireducens DSM 15102 TaxID=1121911 RepID=A0A1T4KFP2_9FIRM|nr:V-type ATP synthase subunit E [Garciella nitratireducens]SJZ41177.1 H+-ATPase subunit E/Vma4 [Garciella nitratireducens DSM 15102]